jgi:hypothetical protein
MSVGTHDDNAELFDGIGAAKGQHVKVLSTHVKPERVEEGPRFMSSEEAELAKILAIISPTVLPTDKSVLLSEIPDDVLDKIFAKNVRFSDKVSLVKPYLGQPFRPALVAELPTSTRDVVKHLSSTKKAIEILYVLRCIVSIFPEFADDAIDLARICFSGEEENFNNEQMNEVLEYLTRLRGTSAAVSAVVAAALKLFYTVDGMAFDDFSQTLSALEWEIITANMNEIRLAFAQKIREKATEKYHMETSKKVKLMDKEELDREINAARHPLVRIMKLTLEDFHRETQLFVSSKLNIRGSSKNVKFDRKDLLAKVKSVILEQYRSNNGLDIVKYAKSTPIKF